MSLPWNVVVRLSALSILFLSFSVLAQNAKPIPTPEQAFQGSWRLSIQGNQAETNEEGRRILYHYVRFVSNHDLEMHDVYEGEDAKHLGNYSLISPQKFYFSYKGWNDDFALNIISAFKMQWTDPSGKIWMLSHCSTSDCNAHNAHAPIDPNSPIRHIDFRNFDYPASACSLVGAHGFIRVINGKYTYHAGKPDEASFTIPNSKNAIVYGNFLSDGTEQALVSSSCGMELSTQSSSEYFLYTIENGSPHLASRLRLSELALDARRFYPNFNIFQGSVMGAENGKVTFGFSAGTARCCQDHAIMLTYTWKNGLPVVFGGSLSDISALNNGGK